MRHIKNFLTFSGKFILAAAFLCVAKNSFSQERPRDIVKKDLAAAKQDSVKMRLLLEMADSYASAGQFDSGFVFLYNGLAIAGKHFSDKSIFKPPFKKHYTNTIEYLMGYHGNLGSNDSTAYYILLLKKFMEETKDPKGLASVFTMLGINYYNMGDLASSSNAYYESLKLREKTGDKKGLCESYGNLTFIAMASDNPEQALVYGNKALALAKELKDTTMIIFDLGNLSAAYEKNNNRVKAIEYMKESVDIALKTGDSSEIAVSWSALAGYISVSGKTDSAIVLLKSALRIFTAQNDIMHMIDIGTRLGSLYVYLKDDNHALFYLDATYKNARLLNRPSQIRGPAQLLSYIYKRQGKHKEALDMFELYVRMNDSLTNAEAKKSSTKKQFQYEYDKRSAADSVKNAEKQKVKDAELAAQSAKLKQEKTERYSLIVGLFIVLVGLGFVINRFRITNKQKKIIEEQKIAVDEAFEKLNEKNKEVMDSIHYARRIQRALIATDKSIEKMLKKLRE